MFTSASLGVYLALADMLMQRWARFATCLQLLIVLGSVPAQTTHTLSHTISIAQAQAQSYN